MTTTPNVPLGVIAGVHDADRDPATTNAIVLQCAVNGYLHLHASAHGSVVEATLRVPIGTMKSPEEGHVLSLLFGHNAPVGTRVLLEAQLKKMIPVGLRPIVRQELYARGYRSWSREMIVYTLRALGVLGVAFGIGLLIDNPPLRIGLLLIWFPVGWFCVGLLGWLTAAGRALRRTWTNYQPSLNYDTPEAAEAELPLIAMLASNKLHDWCAAFAALGNSPHWLIGWNGGADELYAVLTTTWEAFKEAPEPPVGFTSGSASVGSGG